MGRPLSLRHLLCAIGIAFSTLALADHAQSDRGPNQPDPVQRENLANAGWPIGAFALTDQSGKAFTQERLKGRWTFVLFGNTHCADSCTSALSVLAGLVKRIAATPAAKVTQVLYVSTDPQRDTSQRLHQYLAPYGAGFVGVTGAPTTLKRLVEETGVGDAGTAGSIAHSDSIVLVGPDGVIRVEYLPPFDTKRLTAEFLKIRLRG